VVGVEVKGSVDTAWRHPPDVVSGWEGASRVNAALLRHRVSGSWWECLESAGLTLIVTREYEHLVIALSVVDGKPLVSYLPLPHPSGVAVDRRRNVVHVASTRNPNQIFELTPVNDLMPRPDVKKGGLQRATLVPTRARMFPGEGFDFAWWPRCAEGKGGRLIQRNHLQLNSIAAGTSLRSSYFSASTDTISRLRPGHPDFPVDRRGVLFSGATREPIAFGLTRPHSARLRRGRVWLLNSGYGEYGFVDDGAFRPVATLPGWTRGLCFHGRTAFVGTSRVLPRFRQYAPGVSIDRASCGVHAIDVSSGRVLGSLSWPAGDQIFGIEWMPRSVAESLPFVPGAAAPPLTLFYAYRPPGVRLPRRKART
jgi:hypothetical protein